VKSFQVTVLCYVEPWSLVDRYQSFGGNYYLYLEDMKLTVTYLVRKLWALRGILGEEFPGYILMLCGAVEFGR
jgi:hypothetical protein